MVVLHVGDLGDDRDPTVVTARRVKRGSFRKPTAEEKAAHEL